MSEKCSNLGQADPRAPTKKKKQQKQQLKPKSN